MTFWVPSGGQAVFLMRLGPVGADRNQEEERIKDAELLIQICPVQTHLLLFAHSRLTSEPSLNKT